MPNLRTITVLSGSLALLAGTAAAAGPRPAVPGGLSVWVTGDAADATVAVSGGPCAMLMGGGTDVDAAFRDHAFPRMPHGDVVVIRASGSNGYNNYLYSSLTTGANQPNSVETMLLNSRAFADSTYAEWVLDTAELIFAAGGDQSDYVNFWAGTRTEAALNRAWQRGAIVGGTSAGMAIMGEFIYDPDNVTAATTASAIADPYSEGIIISPRLLQAPVLDGIITDTHFFQRTRMGRPLAFMARLRQDARADQIAAICANEATCLFIDGTGRGTVVGSGNVYVLREDSATVRQQVATGQPLIYRNVLRAKLKAGDTITLPALETTVGWMPLSVDGTNASSPFTPTNPYADFTAPPTATPAPSPSGLASTWSVQ